MDRFPFEHKLKNLIGQLASGLRVGKSRQIKLETITDTLNDLGLPIDFSADEQNIAIAGNEPSQRTPRQYIVAIRDGVVSIERTV